MSDENILRQINLMKRRHSIQVLLPSVSISGDLGKSRRQSLTASIQNITKSVSKAMHIGSSVHNNHYDIKPYLTKPFFKDLLSHYYHQPELKVIKLSVRCLSTEERLEQTPDTALTDLLLREEKPESSGSGFWYQGIYEVEVWVKCESGKKKLDLVVMWPPRQKSSESQSTTGTANSSNHSSREHLSSEEDHRYQREQETEQEIRNRKQSLQDQIVMEEDETESGIETHEKTQGIEPRPLKIENLGLAANTQRAFEAEREYKAFTTVIRDLWNYLREEKGVRHPEQLLSIPINYPIPPGKFQEMLSTKLEPEAKNLIGRPSSNGNSSSQILHKNSKIEFDYEELLVLQDLFGDGYHMARVEHDETGLDFNHTILAMEKLAAFHAASYCMRKEKHVNFKDRYLILQEDPVYRTATADLFGRTQGHIIMRLHNIFQQNHDSLSEFSAFFLDAVQNWHQLQQKLVKPNEKFGVICHGDLWRQNALYFYGSCMESQRDVMDVRFMGLHNIRFASCVTDLVYFMFTSVDIDIRRDHVVNFLMAYHDHFVKTVRSLCGSSMKIFSRDELFTEFQRQSMFGFLEALSLFSTAYESQLHRAESVDGFHDVIEHPRYQDYRDTVLALIADVIRIRFQGQPQPEKTNSH